MKKCTVNWENNQLVKIIGVIDELADFFEEVKKFPPEVYLDMSEVMRINSCGVRQWANAIKSSTSKIYYINTPSVVIDQIIMVPEFMGKNSTILSFEGHYICEACGLEEVIYLKIGEDIIKNLPEYTEAPKRNCSKCGNLMEFEHDIESYFSFLLNLK